MSVNDRFERTAFRLSLFNLLVVSLLGLTLRAARVWSIPHLNYTFLLHGHSHFAFSAWAFSVLSLLMVRRLLPESQRSRKAYRQVFWLAQLAAYGMLASFPFEGYQAISISFSTLFVLVTYAFAWRFYRDSRTQGPRTPSMRLAHASLAFLVLSSVGPFALGPLMAMGYANTPIYIDAVYFYLHFQYNGWFSLAVLALFFHVLESRQGSWNLQLSHRFASWMIYSCLPAAALSMLWSKPAWWVYGIAWVGAAAQTVAFVYAVRVMVLGPQAVVPELYRHKRTWPASVRLLWSLALTAFLLKLIMQTASALPAVAQLAATYRPFVIGYLHLVLLGFITLFILGCMVLEGQLNLDNLRSRLFLYMFVAGILLTELLLFAQAGTDTLGIGIPHVDLALLVVSLPLPIGLAGLQAAGPRL